MLAVSVEFSQPVFSAYENESEIIIKLGVTRPALATFTVIVSATPGTADGKWQVFDQLQVIKTLSDSDFVVGNTSVTFGPTDTQANSSIVIRNDNKLEFIEEFNLTVILPDTSKAIGIKEGAPVFAVVRILNDDSMLSVEMIYVYTAIINNRSKSSVVT